MLKRILSQAASLGVSRIYLVNANRVEKSFFNASLLHANAYNTYLHHGLEQAVDTFLPELSIHHRFKPFVEDLLPKINNDYPIRLVAHPDADMTLPERITPPLTKRVLLAIGPEGGWVDYEISKFQEQGMRSFAMGPRILKVDTAVAALLAQIDLLRQIGSTETPGYRK
jgi:RsmE family RNA methyltransferase